MHSEPTDLEGNRAAMRQMLVAGFSAGVVILAGKLWLMPWLARYLGAPAPDLAAQHFTRFMQGFAAFLVVMALWMATYAWRIFRSGQVPPPGAWGLRRAPRTGREARAAGLVVSLCAAALVALAVFALRIPERTRAAQKAAHAPAHGTPS